MKYMGSKARIAKHILPIMLEEAEKRGITSWVEPFVGGANIIKSIPKSMNRIGYDKNVYLIEMYKYLQKNGFNYPEEVSKELYDACRTAYNTNSWHVCSQEVDASFIGWVGFMASANGRFFDGGYSGISKTKIGTERNYISESVRGLKKEFPDLKGVEFISDDYLNLDFKNTLIYCDPPYKGTKTYNTSKNFNHDQFFDWCREQTKRGNVVFVSEYEAPEDFECVWQQEVKSSLSANGTSGGNKVSVEKLFKVSV